MGRHTLVYAVSGKHGISLRTVSRSGKPPHSFSILRDELAELEYRNKITVQDIRSFAVLCRNAYTGMLRVEFTWLQDSGYNISGFLDTVEIPYGGFMKFVRDSSREGGPAEWKGLSADSSWKQPQIVFDSRKNLHEALENRIIRRKLVRCLRDRFKRPGTDRIGFYDDFLPYSFGFCEIREGKTAVRGGLILHRQDDMEKAYYEIHT